MENFASVVLSIKTIPWAIILLVMLAAVGNMELIKGIIKIKLPAWLLTAMAIVLVFGFFAITVYLSVWILYAAVASALMQLCYQIILQGIPILVKELLGIKDEATKPVDTSQTKA